MNRIASLKTNSEGEVLESFKSRSSGLWRRLLLW